MTQHIRDEATGDQSRRKASLIGGLSLLLIAVLAPVGHYGIIQRMIVDGDAGATVERISASAGLFRVGICLLLANAILDLVAAWALYIVLKPTHRSLSLLSAWFRVVYSAILIVALGHLLHVTHLVSGVDSLSSIAPERLAAMVMLQLQAHDGVWTLGLVMFALHLLTLGYLLLQSSQFPKYLGALVAVAGLGYFVDHVGVILFPGAALNIAVYTFIGELLLIPWLLLKGVRGFEGSA